MILLVFAASILVSVLLDRQARQHKLERAREYERLGILMPRPQPRLKRTEAWLNVGLGILLALMAFGSVWTGIMQLHMAEQFPVHAADLIKGVPLMVETGAFYLAGAIALIWLGWKAIREIARYESGAPPAIQRTMRLNLTVFIAAGAFCAGILTGYLIISRETPPPSRATTGQATVSLSIQSGDESALPPGFADDLTRRFESEISALPGVTVVRDPDAAFLFNAKLGRDDGHIVISWNVVRSRDKSPYFNRTFAIPFESAGNQMQSMITSLSTSFGEKRTTAEFERIFQLPENSLD